MPRRNQEEIDFLMEHEYALQAELDRVHARLELLLGQEAVAKVVKLPRPRHLTVVPDPPEGA